MCQKIEQDFGQELQVVIDEFLTLDAATKGWVWVRAFSFALARRNSPPLKVALDFV